MSGLHTYRLWQPPTLQQQPEEQPTSLHHTLYGLAPKGLNKIITQHHEGIFLLPLERAGS